MVKKTVKIILAICSPVLLAGCEYFEKTEDNREVLARVNNTYLYKEDIEALIDENISEEDSTLIVNNYINRWATQQLLIDKAMYNLSISQQQEFDELVRNYKNELYTKAYADALVARQMNVELDEEEIAAYYEENKESFKLNEDLVKFRFISLDKNTLDFQNIKRQFTRFNEQDREELDKISLQFNSHSFNDSIWVSSKTVFNNVGPLNDSNKAQLLKKSNFLQLEDSLEVYLIFVQDVLVRNDQAPLEYAYPTIRQIILNRRKANLIKELEKDLTRDAIENKQFEIYN